MEANKHIFKAGDRIFHIQYGWGTIKDVIDDGVMIYFDDYSVNRVSLFNKHIKLLSFTEYTLKGFSQERPEELPNVGDIIWIRGDFPDEWTVGHFFKKEDGKYYISYSPAMKGWHTFGIEYKTTNPYKPTEQ